MRHLLATALLALVASTADAQSTGETIQGTSTEEALAAGTIEALPGDLARFHGLVVSAPHGSYDQGTAEMVEIMHAAHDFPTVIARGFRLHGGPTWLDINRPTERFQQDNGWGAPRHETAGARAVYERYQTTVFEMAGVPGGPIDLHVDIHGFGSTYERPNGERAQRHVIEAVATGFTDDQVRAIVAEYERLVAEEGLQDPPPMYFHQTDPFYEIEGVELDLQWTATGARRLGVLRPECATRGLHFENPLDLRRNAERRDALARVYGQLVAWIWERLHTDWRDAVRI